MIQAAHFDIKSVTGLRQALVLSAEYENEPFPLEGYTLHGSIGTYPRMDLKCSVDENGRARIEWDSVPPGNWKYDVFLISASNDENPLMEGTFTALPRITPVLDDESVNDEVGGVLHLPSGNEGTITLEVDGGFVSKEYAAIAKDAADKAQQALEDIKQALQGVVTSIGGASGDTLLDSGLKITGDREKGNVSLSLDDKTVVLTAGDQTIDGVKTFSSPPVIASAPASNNEAANKKYVDDMASKATGTTINGVSGNITLTLPMELDPDTKSMSVDLSGYASLQTDNVFEGGNTFMAGIKGHVDSVTGTAILYATNVPGDSSSGHPVLTIEHIGSSNVRISSGTHLMLKARGGNIYAESSFTANNSVNVYGSALFNSGVTASQSLTVGGHAQFNDTVRVETGKIDPGNFGHTWIFGSLIDSPTTADNNNHRLCCKSTSDNAAYILYHERVVNGAWMKDKIIPACQFDFSWHNDASIVVKDPTKAEQAANKNYVDSQFNCLSLSYMTLDTPQTVGAEKTFTGNVHINTNGNNGTLTLKTSGGTGYLVMDTGEFSISTQQLNIGGHTIVQALHAVNPALFTSGVTMNQSLTVGGLVNANGGINIPLAVGAATDTSAVNRLYAAGMAAVTDAFSVRCYPLLADCSSSNGTVFKTDREPNSLYFNVPPNSAFTVKCGLVTNARPMHNYSSIRGWVAPLRLPAVSTKFTARFGQMTTVARMGRDRDAFTLVPDQAAGGYRIGEIIDITFDHVRDADAGGYHIRVREIYYSNAEQKWKMKTTQALAPETSSNTGYPVCVYAVVYEQYQDGGYDTEDRGALWLLHGGNSSRGCVKIATVKGVHCFESIYPFSGYYLDMENTNSWALAGAFLPATMHLHCNNVNPAYYGFSSMESNIIVSEAVEDFVDPEAETITED